MVDIAFVLAALTIFFFLGFPVSRLLCPVSVRARALTAPVLGFGLFGIAVTILYRFGVSPTVGGLLILAPALISAAGWMFVQRTALPEHCRGPLRFFLLTVAVLLVCLAPKWIGGAQFYAFQGNIWDNVNYISYSSAFGAHSFSELSALTPVSPAALQNDYLYFARSQLEGRPTVGIVLAALAGMMHLLTPEVSYSYLMLLQVMMLFAAAFVLSNMFRTHSMAPALAAAALTLGFFMQYVVDINAWSHLAAMPLALLAATFVVLALSPAALLQPNRPPAEKIGVLPAMGRIGVSYAMLVTITVASLLYFYPEILLVYGSATAVLAGVVLLISRFSMILVGRLVVIGAGAGVGMAACLPFWEGTVGHLLRQTQFASANHVDWWRYFQRYLFGQDVNYGVDYPYVTHHLDSSWSTLYVLFSFPVDFAAGAIGAVFALPPASLPLLYRLLWKLALCFLLVWLLVAVGQCLRAIWRRESQETAFRIAILTLAACVLPFAFVVIGHYWAGGKALAMVAPLLFMVLAVPFLYPEARRHWRAVSALYVVAHLGLGLYRPIAAGHANGIHYSFPPYPSIQDGASKIDLSWNIGQWRPVLRDCRQASIDVGNPFLDRYLQVYLSELHLDWSTVRPLNSYYGTGVALGSQPQPARPDCLLTDRLDHVQPWQSVIWLGRDRTPWDFYRGAERRLDVVTASPASVTVEGLYGVEAAISSGPVRWTNGAARITVANNTPGGPVTRLELDVAPNGLAPGTKLRVQVNDRTLFHDVVPASGLSTSVALDTVPAAPALDIRLISTPWLPPPAETRSLGVLLRHLTLVR